MIPAVTASQMRELDRVTVREVGIPGLILMENAGRACANVALERFSDRLGQGVAVLCGKGNNGGDGFVVARYLHNRGVAVRAYLLGRASEVKGDARTNLEIARAVGVDIVEIDGDSGLRPLNLKVGLVVDAMFGTGLERPLQGLPAKAVERLGRSGAAVLAVDIPSGLDSDRGRLIGPCVRADMTVTFGLPKIGQLLEPGRSMCGALIIADISIPPEVVDDARICVGMLEMEDLIEMFPPRPANTHKGSYGKVAAFGASRGLTGALALAGQAAVRIGAGLVTCAVPDELNPIFEAKLTEAMTLPLPSVEGSLCPDSLGAALESARDQDVVLLGPGLGSAKAAREFARRFAAGSKGHLVIDADGLNAWAGEVEGLAERRAQTILLPHPGEAARLLGTGISDVQSDRIGAAMRLAEVADSIVVLKGAATVVADPDGTATIIPTGNPGMATGGAGDVLAGMVLGLWAQWFNAFEAAASAAYLHGWAGDRARRKLGERALIASDILEELPNCLNDLERVARGEQPAEAE